MSTNTLTFLLVLSSCSLPSQLAYNARHDTTHASVSWLTAPLGVVRLATELATSRLPVRRASFLPRYTHRTYVYTENVALRQSNRRFLNIHRAP